MAALAKYFNLILAVIISFMSTVVFVINYYDYQFPGNNYFPHQMPSLGIILILALLGTYLLFEANSTYFKIVRELVYFFLVISVIANATNAIQLTPFNPIDEQLISIDHAFSIHLEQIMAWTASIPWLSNLLKLSYDSLSYQMAYLPFVMIFARKFSYLHEYYLLLLLTALLGFSFYYFFPTMGPASFMQSPYFITEQYATGVKFAEIHRHIPPSTIDGGMIAMPSFHAIWACLCLYLSRCWPILFIVLLPLNILLIASCVLLGWHYFIDLIGSLITLVLAYGIYFFVKTYSLPRKPLFS